jgi:uncharacterized membrane protein YozB (DUF420 family)
MSVREPKTVAPLPRYEKAKSFGGLLRRMTMQRTFGRWAARGFLGSMLLGSALITCMSLPYFDFETLPPFVIEKLPLRFESLWLAALRVHVAAAALGFPLCLLLLTRALQRRVVWHRWLGRVTGGLLLFALLPSGVVLAFDAKGGAVVTAGFLLSAVIVATALIFGVRAARRRDLISHARAMRHVVGQMSVAVVSRALIVALDSAGVAPDVAYVAALWGPVLASAVLVEWLSRRPIFWLQTPIYLIERMRREISPLALVLRVRARFHAVVRAGR